MVRSTTWNGFYQLLLSDSSKKRSERIILVIAIASFIIHLLLICLADLGIIRIPNSGGLLKNPIVLKIVQQNTSDHGLEIADIFTILQTPSAMPQGITLPCFVHEIFETTIHGNHQSYVRSYSFWQLPACR